MKKQIKIDEIPYYWSPSLGRCYIPNDLLIAFGRRLFSKFEKAMGGQTICLLPFGENIPGIYSCDVKYFLEQQDLPLNKIRALD